MMRCRNVSKALAIGFLLLATPGIARPPEYRTKAEYLLLFLRYVTWPATALPVADSPLVIGVLGGDPFGALLDSTFSCARSQGREIRVRRVHRAEDADAFHVVFIPRGDPRLREGWLDTLRNRPVLTVVETEHEFESGAIIRLLMVDGHLRFDVNLSILRDSGLKIDAPMLVSARRIVRNNGSG